MRRKSMPDEKGNQKDEIFVEKIHATTAAIGTGASVIVNNLFMDNDPKTLREWWFEIIRTHGFFSCYAVFLMLPSDKELIDYLANYGREIHVMSGDNCLVIALRDSEYMSHEGFSDGNWKKSIEVQNLEGYSTIMARIFGIEFTKFPCVLLFQDIRSPEHVVIELDGMCTLEIAKKMRTLFSVIEKAVGQQKEPLSELKNQNVFNSFLSKQHVNQNEIDSNIEKMLKTDLRPFIEMMMLLPKNIVVNNEIIEGDRISIGNITNSNGLAIGRESKADVNHESNT